MLMALAVFNPLCCCTAAGALAVGEPEMAIAMHSCCESQKANQPEGGSHGVSHDPGDCPHQALKDSQASQAKDQVPIYDASLLLPTFLEVDELVWTESMALPKHAVSLATESVAPPIPLLQVHCIYRI